MVLSCLEGCAKRRRRFVNLVEANDLKKEDLATLGFVYSTLSLCIWYCPIKDCCICSYEAHLNIKEEFILGFSPERVSPRKTLCLLFMLFTLLYIALTGYIHALWLMLLVI